MPSHEAWMQAAIDESLRGMRSNQGGPFGAVIVFRGALIARCHNQVLSTNDPTAHAEILAIREACRHLSTFRLDECDLYTSCEPCPMCLGAIYWSHVRSVFFGNTHRDAARVGFDDQFIYDEMRVATEARRIPMIQLLASEAAKAMVEWEHKRDKLAY